MDTAGSGPVTIMDGNGEVIEVLTIEEFRKKHWTRICKNHYLVGCFCDVPAIPDKVSKPFLIPLTKAQRTERAKKAANARWREKIEA